MAKARIDVVANTQPAQASFAQLSGAVAVGQIAVEALNTAVDFAGDAWKEYAEFSREAGDATSALESGMRSLKLGVGEAVDELFGMQTVLPVVGDMLREVGDRAAATAHVVSGLLVDAFKLLANSVGANFTDVGDATSAGLAGGTDRLFGGPGNSAEDDRKALDEYIRVLNERPKAEAQAAKEAAKTAKEISKAAEAEAKLLDESLKVLEVQALQVSQAQDLTAQKKQQADFARLEAEALRLSEAGELDSRTAEAEKFTRLEEEALRIAQDNEAALESQVDTWGDVNVALTAANALANIFGDTLANKVLGAVGGVVQGLSQIAAGGPFGIITGVLTGISAIAGLFGGGPSAAERAAQRAADQAAIDAERRAIAEEKRQREIDTSRGTAGALGIIDVGALQLSGESSGALWGASFWDAVEDLGLAGAIEAFGPAMEQLREAFGEDLPPGLEAIGRLFDLFNDENLQPIFKSLEGLEGLFDSLIERGGIGEETFVGMQEALDQAFQRLIEGGASQEEALAAILPLLARINAEAEESGKPIEGTTEELLKMAEEAGLELPTITDVFGDMRDLLKEIVVLLGGATEEMKDFGRAADDVRIPGPGTGGTPSAAGGGVFTGPSSGYWARLHGTEAVTPMGGQRGGPISINAPVSVSGGRGSPRALGDAVALALEQKLSPRLQAALNRQGA